MYSVQQAREESDLVCRDGGHVLMEEGMERCVTECNLCGVQRGLLLIELKKTNGH